MSQIMDVACLGGSRVESKQDEKVHEYRNLAMEIKELWNMKTVKIVPVVIGCLGTIPERLEGNFNKIGSRMITLLVQKTVLLEIMGESFRESSVSKVTC